MSQPLSFQQVILRLQEYWADQGCVLWQPFSEKVGAGTLNPATALRVLGPEPWNVAYVEPSFRPDDGRFGDNPNRMQMHTQFQVILKPDPGDPQQLYLESLYALGINRDEHDIRFVEDNWESPALGAWGLGWEVWLDGLEITQFTYFQQAGGMTLDPVSVEITYGLERIVMFLQDVRSVWDIHWDDTHSYGDVLLQQEIDYCRYEFNLADVERLTRMYDLFEMEAEVCLAAGLVVPAHDYVLRCSHTFNLLDTRGAIGITERASYFRRMRDLSRRVAETYVKQRQRAEYPFLSETGNEAPSAESQAAVAAQPSGPSPLLVEIGTEELPAGDLDAALDQLRVAVPQLLDEARLDYDGLTIAGTPRRLAVMIESVAPAQRAIEEVVKGPPTRVAFDADGAPTRAAEGFAGRLGISVADLEVREVDGGEYVVGVHREAGQPASQVLAAVLPDLLAGLSFQRSMRWNDSGVAFSRPIRWLVALLGSTVIPIRYAGLVAGSETRGSRPEGSPRIAIDDAAAYRALLAAHHIIVDLQARRTLVAKGAQELATRVEGVIPDDPDLLAEVTNLVEWPTPFLGHFEEQYLRLPSEVLIAVMRKHQRYFPVRDGEGQLLPHFVGVRNGGDEHMDVVRHGNEAVIRARFADADYFYQQDVQEPLETYVSRLDTLTFQEQLGSMLDKTRRLEALVPWLAGELGLSDEDGALAQRAAHLCKADLATQMVVELTSLQGLMGREYALKAGEPPQVADAIFEHYLPRSAGDDMPQSRIGLLLGVANRLDSLVGLFAVGLKPTGSADPYHLRRDALGLVESLIAHRVSFSVADGLEHAGRKLPVDVDGADVLDAVDFVVERLRGYLRDRGFAYDVVDAVLAARGADPYRAFEAVQALSRWVDREDWELILDNYARCVRITRDVEGDLSLDPEVFEQTAETALYEAYLQARDQVTPESTVDEFFNAFLPLVDRIDHYFARESGVMVMAEDRRLRQNRLAQLHQIAELASGIVDLSRLEGF